MIGYKSQEILEVKWLA